MNDYYFYKRLEDKVHTLSLEIETDLKKITNEFKEGHENLLYDTIQRLKIIALSTSGLIKKLSKFLTPFFMLAYRRAEQAIINYDKLSTIWENRLNEFIRIVDSSTFEQLTTNVVDKDILEKRIDIAIELHELIEDTKNICESKIDLDDNEWATKELFKIHKRLAEIGLTPGYFNLVNKPDKKYENYKYKASIATHGYDLDDLKELLHKAKPIVQYSTKKEMTNISNKVLSYFEQLSREEQAIQNARSISDDKKQIAFNTIQIKTVRLWNITSFVKILQRLSKDIFEDLFILSKTLENIKNKNDSE